MEKELHEMTPEELDQFAAYAHAVHETPGVEIVESEADPHAHMDQNGPHGSNSEEEMVVGK